jgi:hypothetical protein
VELMIILTCLAAGAANLYVIMDLASDYRS